MEKFDEAVRDYETMYKLDSTRDNKRALQDAKLQLKKSQRKDYYKILGVDKSANDDQLKKAYRKRAMIHHPGMVHIPPLGADSIVVLSFF